MRILGIETSCDETAAAIVEDGCNVLSSLINSQVKIHAKTGGIVPEIAAREHIPVIIPLIEEAFKQAGCDWHDIDAIAVTKGPGLIGSLLVGVDTAKTLAMSKGIPLHGMNHIIGHIYANWLDKEPSKQPEFPLIVLTASGGHNELVLMKRHTNMEFLGSTIDDAAGEAFDKVARLIGLGFPGGPAIQKAAANGDANTFNFPRPMLNDGFNFSFSGLKTSVLVTVRHLLERRDTLDKQTVANLAASFQEALVETLVTKLVRAAKEHCAKEIHIAGGVSANARIRELAGEQARAGHLILRYPERLHYCTDNAAMIASAAYFRPNPCPWKELRAEPNLVLA